MKIRRILKISISTCLVFLELLFISPAHSYTDVTSTTPYYSEIKSLENSGLLPETTDDTFQPDKKVTITDFYTLLLTYAKASIVDASQVKLPYKDTSDTAPYAPYIQTAINLNLITPSGDYLQPDKTMVKREIIIKLLDFLGIGVNRFFDRSNFPFTDLDSNGPSAPYAFKAFELGIVDKTKPTSFKIAKPITKAALANILYLIKENESSGSNIITIKLEPNKTSQQNEIDNPTFNIFMDVWNTIHSNYYYKKEIDDKKMLYGAIKGMTGTLSDHYTEFTEPDETSSVKSLQGEYEGVGMSLEMVDNKIMVISPFKDSPAEKAGIKPKDIIEKIDGTSTSGMDIGEAVKLIQGTAGTSVTLTIRRGNDLTDIKIERGFIISHTVELEFLKKGSSYIAHINMYTFGENTLKEFLSAAEAIYNKQTEDKNIKGIILDLRSNPGGYLDTAIQINGFFFKEDKTAVILEDNNGKRTPYTSKYNGIDKEYSSGMGLLADFKIVILVNKGSASASEILTSSLQDYGKAKVIGDQSFGKGTVQEISFYNDNSMFKLTTSKWLTPKGRDINKTGLTPDKAVENTGTVDAQLNAALGEF